MESGVKAVALATTLAACIAGCAPKESFSWIDRHCFVADWTNHYSCVSCCRNGGCGQVYPNVQYPMLELGDSTPRDAVPSPPVSEMSAGDAINDAVEPATDDR